MIEIELKRHVSAATDDENKKKWKVEKIDFNLAFKFFIIAIKQKNHQRQYKNKMYLTK